MGRGHRGLAKLLCGIAGCAALSSAGAAAAQTASNQTEQARDPLLEDIVVTGRTGTDVQVGSFRGSSILEVPATVAVIGRDVLDAQQAVNLGDALKNTPGVNFSQVSPAVSTSVTIRGIAVENRTNYRLNGGLPIINLIDLPVEAFERVEVLKGVSSLYYGFATPAGIVNLIAKRPTRDPMYALNFQGNSNGGYLIHADFGQMNESGTLGFRVNLVGADPDYGVDRTSGARRTAVAAIDINPTDTMAIRLDAQFIHKNVTEPALFQLVAANGTITLPPLLNPNENFSSPWMQTSSDEYNLFAHYDWRFLPNVQLILEGGVSEVERDRQLALLRNVNFTTGAGQLRVGSTNGLRARNTNLRAEVAAGFRTGPLVHQLSVGFTRNERYYSSPSTVNTDYAYNIYTRPILPSVSLGARVVPNPGTVTDEGFYAFDKAGLGEFVDFLGGVRYTRYKNITLIGAPYRVEPTSLSGGVIVKPLPNLSLYASYIEGLEEGGVASALNVNNGEVLPPNTSTQKEIGAKWKIRGDALLTVSYFDIDRASTFVNAANRFVQDGRTSYKGLEGSLTGHIIPELNIILSGTYLDAKQVGVSNPALLGLMPENTAKYSASTFVEYAPAFLSGFAINGGAYYSSRRAVNNSNQAFVPGYTLFSLGGRFGVDIAGVATTVRITADNLTNKRYFAGTGANLVSYGLPRLIKASLGFSF